MHWPGAMRRLVGCCGLAVLVIAGSPESVAAHPSDFETLTVDLLLGARGLEVIDAAVVAGPEYEPFPTPEQRRSIAEQIVAAIGISQDLTRVDAGMSDRYHEVGFTIHLQRPLSNAKRAALRIDTAPLQRIAANAKVEWLKVTFCDRSRRDPLWPSTPSTTIATAESLKLLVDDEPPGRSPNTSRQERPGCRVWRLTADDASLTLTARLVPSASAKPGASTFPGSNAVAALVVIGLAVCALAYRRRGR